MNIRFLAFLLAAFLVGCANYSPVSIEGLRAPSEPQTLVFDKDFLYTNSKPDAVQRFVGLLAGRYTAVFEDDRGVYYRGQGASVRWAHDPEHQTEYLAEGGIWLPKGTDSPRFKIYRIIGTEVTRSTLTGSVAPFRLPSQRDNLTGTTAQTAADQVAGSSPVAAGAGAAIGVSLVAELAKMDVGKIKFDRDDPPPNAIIDGRYRVER